MFQAILDLVYPRTCYLCNASLDSSSHAYFCFSCWRELLSSRQPFCRRCGLFLGEGSGFPGKCLSCMNKKFHFSEVRSAGKYEKGIQRSILSFKFRRLVQLQHPLSALLHHQMRRHPFPFAPETIVAVPMFPSDERKRGYNQARLLAKRLSERLHLPCRSYALVKVKRTPPQEGSSKEERAKNVRDAFDIEKSCRSLFSDKTVLLVDDVLTTGSTVDECSAVLKRHHARRVYVATVARTPEEQ